MFFSLDYFARENAEKIQNFMRAIHPDCYVFQWRPYRTNLLHFCTSLDSDRCSMRQGQLPPSHSIPEPENSLAFESSNELQKISNAFLYGVIKNPKITKLYFPQVLHFCNTSPPQLLPSSQRWRTLVQTPHLVMKTPAATCFRCFEHI